MHHRLRLTLPGLVGLLFVVQAGAADLNPKLVGTWNSTNENERSWLTSVAISGESLLVLQDGQDGDEHALITMDVSNPSHLVELGRYPLSEPNPMRVVTAGNLAYVVGQRDGLAIFDVTNPAEPVWLGGFDTDGYACDVCLVGSYAYIADDIGGLVVLDVSDPTNPTQVGARRFSGAPRGVSVSGHHAYLSDRYPDEYPDAGALRVMDISDPAKPRLIGSLRLEGSALAVAVANGVAYASTEKGLNVIDVSNPARPRRIAKQKTLGSPVVVGDRLMVGSMVLDITDPTSPRRLGGYPFYAIEARAAVAGRYVYMPLGNGSGGGLKILDLEPEANFARVGGLATTGEAVALAVSGTLACVADTDYASRKRVQFIDITDPTHPSPVGEYVTRHPPALVGLQGNRAWVIESWGGDPYYSSLTILDVSNPASPSQLGVYTTEGFLPGGFTIAGDSALLGIGYGVEVIELKDPVHPSRVALYEQQRLGAVNGSVAAILPTWSSDWSGVRFKDLRDPIHPMTLGSYQPDNGDFIATMSLSSNLAFLVTATAEVYYSKSRMGLVVLDLSDPGQPKRLANVAQPNLAWWTCNSVAPAHGYLYVGSGSSDFGSHGVQVYDVRDPAQARYVGGNSAVSVHGLAVAGNYLLAAGGNQGLQVFGPLLGSPAPAPSLTITRMGNALVFRWPASATGFTLESTGPLSSTVTWTPESTPPVIVDGQNAVTLDAGAAARFFRLRKP